MVTQWMSSSSLNTTVLETVGEYFCLIASRDSINLS